MKWDFKLKCDEDDERGGWGPVGGSTQKFLVSLLWERRRFSTIRWRYLFVEKKLSMKNDGNIVNKHINWMFRAFGTSLDGSVRFILFHFIWFQFGLHVPFFLRKYLCYGAYFSVLLHLHLLNLILLILLMLLLSCVHVCHLILKNWIFISVDIWYK